MNRSWTDKIQVTLLFVSISWKKEYLHDFKASLEEVIVMLPEGNEGNEGKIHKGVCLKECLYVNLQACIWQLQYELISSQVIYRDFD